jgi:hypothetical protein
MSRDDFKFLVRWYALRFVCLIVCVICLGLPIAIPVAAFYYSGWIYGLASLPALYLYRWTFDVGMLALIVSIFGIVPIM